MISLPGKRILLEMFSSEGVEFMFGNPGTSEAPMIEIMRDYPKIRYILALQEGVAVGIADGYWRGSGKTPLVSLHIDNGMANGLSLMVDQKHTYGPMVLTAGNKDIKKLAAGRADLAEMARPFAKWSAEITCAEQIVPTIRRAFQEATSPLMGPAFVAMSANAFEEETETLIQPSIPVVPPAPDTAAIEEAASLIAKADNPLLIVGGRVSEYGGQRSIEAAAALAESGGMPVYGHYSSSLDFPATHPLWQGRIMVRHPDSVKLLQNADVIVAAGCPVFEDFFYISEQILKPHTKLIHIDASAEEIGRSEPAYIGMVAEPGRALQLMAEAVMSAQTGAQREAAKVRAKVTGQRSEARREAFIRRAATEKGSSPMTETAMAKAVADALPDDAALFNDGISISPSIYQAASPSKYGSYFSGRGQAIGWGVGATMGLKLGVGDRPVVGVIGDGSAMMTIQGLWTAVNDSIPAVFVICNNASYRILKINMNHYQRLTGREPSDSFFAMDFETPIDFAAQARAYGARGVRATTPDELTREIRSGIASGAPTVVDAVVDGGL